MRETCLLEVYDCKTEYFQGVVQLICLLYRFIFLIRSVSGIVGCEYMNTHRWRPFCDVILNFD